MSKLFIDGQWVAGEAAPAVVLNKYSGEPFGEMDVASEKQIRQAIAGVKAGFGQVKLSPYERYSILMKAAEIINSRKEEFVKTMIGETGFTKNDCENEFKRAAMIFMLSAEEAKRITGDIIPVESMPGVRNRMGYTIRVPRGVVCAITPFNAPLSTVAHKIAPALAAGNSVILKPAGYTPFISVLLTRALLDAGLPPCLFSLVNGAGSQIGPLLIADQRIAFYTFTGSTEVGLEIQRGARLRGVSLELGSIASTLICHDADLDVALPKVASASFRKAGQVCTSTQRILVDRRIAGTFYDRFVPAVAALKTGDPSLSSTDVGPMISLYDAQRAESWVAEAVSGGAELLTGGTRERSVLQPAILRNVTMEMRVARQEIFAPVVVVIEYNDFREAIDYANNTSYGLSAGVFTSNVSTAMEAIRSLDFGGIHINEASSARIDLMPFGGVKDSGLGHEGPYHAIREMTEERMVTIAF